MNNKLLFLGLIPLGVAVYFAMFDIRNMAIGTIVSLVPVVIIWFAASKKSNSQEESEN